MPENLDSEQRDRLWNHLLHVETQLYGRVTLFLTIETVLLAIVGIVYSKPGLSLLVVKAIVFLGLCITIIWYYLQERVKQVFDAVNKRALDNLPEYQNTENAIYKERWPLRRLSTSHTPVFDIETRAHLAFTKETRSDKRLKNGIQKSGPPAAQNNAVRIEPRGFSPHCIRGGVVSFLSAKPLPKCQRWSTFLNAIFRSDEL
jgi:hypothetical protein